MGRKQATWEVSLKESVLDDLCWFGKKIGRLLLKEAELQLAIDPLAENRNRKPLRTKFVAGRELRLQGRYRVLFNVDEEAREVTMILVGEKRGELLVVRGEEFSAHHENDPPQ